MEPSPGIVPPYILDRIKEWPERKALLERIARNLGQLADERAKEEEKQND